MYEYEVGNIYRLLLPAGNVVVVGVADLSRRKIKMRHWREKISVINTT